MTRESDLAAKADRLRARQAAPSDTETSEAPRAAAPVRVRPVRLTVDVSPADHAALNRWCLDAAAELGTARVAGQEIVRALLARALTDPAMRTLVVADIAEQRRRNS